MSIVYVRTNLSLDDIGRRLFGDQAEIVLRHPEQPSDNRVVSVVVKTTDENAPSGSQHLADAPRTQLTIKEQQPKLWFSKV